MKTVNILFEKRSIKKAIEQLKKINLQKIITDFLTLSAEWVKDKANYYLSNINIDGNIIADIQSGWQLTTNGDTATLTNISDKAVFVEFGVGRAARQFGSHPNADNTNYEYDVDTPYKDEQGFWRYPLGNSAVDLKNGYFSIRTNPKTGEKWVKTMGSPASLYLYNASQDLITTGEYHNLWNKAIEQTLKG